MIATEQATNKREQATTLLLLPTQSLALGRLYVTVPTLVSVPPHSAVYTCESAVPATCYEISMYVCLSVWANTTFQKHTSPLLSMTNTQTPPTDERNEEGANERTTID